LTTSSSSVFERPSKTDESFSNCTVSDSSIFSLLTSAVCGMLGSGSGLAGSGAGSGGGATTTGGAAAGQCSAGIVQLETG